MGIRGHCMEPTLRDGDKVRVVPKTRLLPGDILIIDRGKGPPSAHRLLGFRLLGRHIGVVTQADNTTTPDPPAHLKDIVGHVVERVGTRPQPIQVPYHHRLRAFYQYGRWLTAALRRKVQTQLKP